MSQKDAGGGRPEGLTSFSYIDVPPAAIANKLEEFFVAQGGSPGIVPAQAAEQSFLRAAQHNVILPLASVRVLDEVDRFLEWVGEVHPSRFFVVAFDPAARQLSASVSARCYLIPGGGSSHLCSEVIRLICPPSQASAAAALLRSNLLPGALCEAFLYDRETTPQLLDFIAPLCDELFFDSGSLEMRADLAPHLLRRSWTLIDVEWFALSAWRDQIRMAFEIPQLAGAVDGIESIDITSEWIDHGARKGIPAACGMLLGGWFLDRLGLELIAFGATGFECSSKTGRGVLMQLFSREGSHLGEQTSQQSAHPFARIGELSIVARIPGKGKVEIILRRGSVLEAEVRGVANLRFSRPFEEESRTARLRRYFSIGESTHNYPAALRFAHEMESLRRGFL